MILNVFVLVTGLKVVKLLTQSDWPWGIRRWAGLFSISTYELFYVY